MFVRKMLVLILVACMLGAAPAATGQPAPHAMTAAVTGHLAVPMRDGQELAATLYRPDRAGRWPVVVLFTPYGRNFLNAIGLRFAGQGLALLVVDVRGRGDSAGRFRPFEQDAEDAYDTIEWAARQDFSTGSIAMAGTSYGGYVQWAAAKLRPPSLKGIVPSASVLPGWDFPMRKNISYPYLSSWIAYTYGRLTNIGLFADSNFLARHYREAYATGVPFRKLDTFLGFPSPIFQEWVDNPTNGSYWRRLQPTPEQFAAIDLPILSVTGQFDGAQMGVLEYHRRHMAAAPAKARAKHFLIIGPFDHAGTRFPAAKVAGIEIPKAGLIDVMALDFAYYRWVLGLGPQPEFLKDTVAYFVLGADEWRYAPALDKLGTVDRVLYLDPAGRAAASLASAGVIADRKPAADVAVDYRFDPADFSRTATFNIYSGDFLVDDSFVRAIDGNGLVFETGPLPEGTEVIGQPTLELQVRMDVPDTDVQARLYEVRVDGSVVLLTADAVRARYRDGLSEEKLVTPGETIGLTLDQFFFTARRLASGSRLRLVVSALDTVQAQRNFQSGKTIADETIADSRPGRITVLTGGEKPSRLVLPISAPRP